MKKSNNHHINVIRLLDFEKYLENAEMELEYRKISKIGEKIVEKIHSN